MEETGNNYHWFYPYGHAAASPRPRRRARTDPSVRDPDARVRRAAAYACDYLGPVAGDGVMPLLKAMSPLPNWASAADREAASGAMWALDKSGSADHPGD